MLVDGSHKRPHLPQIDSKFLQTKQLKVSPHLTSAAWIYMYSVCAAVVYLALIGFPS